MSGKHFDTTQHISAINHYPSRCVHVHVESFLNTVNLRVRLNKAKWPLIELMIFLKLTDSERKDRVK